MSAFSPISFWMDQVQSALPPLRGEVAVDVGIVGGGLTGLSTALALRQEGLSVALLERDVVGAGASGRNCGQMVDSRCSIARRSTATTCRARSTPSTQLFRHSCRALEEARLAFVHPCEIKIDDGRRLRLHTATGSVTCDRCVLATNAYSPRNGWLKRSIVPVSVSVIVTEPLSPAQRARIGWPGGEPMYTAHQILENLRLTADGRVLIGTKRVRLGFGNTEPRPNDPRVRDTLERTLRERFPELDDVRVDRSWTGQVGVTLDFLPIFGQRGRHGNVYYGAGYSGHGLSMASYAGTILSDLMMGRDPGPARALIDRFTIPVPPEPFRWIGGQALFKTLETLDRRLDRRVRRNHRHDATPG